MYTEYKNTDYSITHVWEMYAKQTKIQQQQINHMIINFSTKHLRS